MALTPRADAAQKVLQQYGGNVSVSSVLAAIEAGEVASPSGSGTGSSTVTVVAQSATPAINTDTVSVASITGLAQAITSMTTNLTGTPTAGKTLQIQITDNGTGRAITWGTSFESSTVALPTTTVASAMLAIGFIWNAATSKWRCVALA